MAFAIRNLSVLAYANGFTLWHYKAGKDRLAQVERADFFADAADMLGQGDMMMVSAPDGGASSPSPPAMAAMWPRRGWSDGSSCRNRPLQHLVPVPQRSGLGERISSVRSLDGEAVCGKARQAGAVLQTRRSPGVLAQRQPMEGRAATCLKIRLIPHSQHRRVSLPMRQAVRRCGRACDRTAAIGTSWSFAL